MAKSIFAGSTIQQAITALLGIKDRGVFFIEGPKTETFVSYDDLLHRSLVWLGHLQRQGVEPNQEVVLQLPDGPFFVYAFWACIIGGMIPVPLTPAYNEQTTKKLFYVLGRLKNPHLVTVQMAEPLLTAYLSNPPTVFRNTSPEALKRNITIAENVAMTGPQGNLVERKPFDIAVIQYSSGSTGNPKGVILSHANITANCEAIAVGMEGDPQKDCGLSWMPLTHDMGLIGQHILPTINGANHFLIPPQLFVKKPWLWMDKISEHRITGTAAPNFGYKLFLKHFKKEQAKNWDLSCLRIIFNGAEPISFTLCDRFLTALEPYGLAKSTIFPVYGLAEATLAVTFPPVGQQMRAVSFDRESLTKGAEVHPVARDKPNSSPLPALGRPVKGCELRIADENDQALPAGHVGEIQLSGKSITRGYWRDRNNTKAVFTADHWLRTGDLGFIHEGSLFFAGRKKEIIFVHGANFYPADLEATLEELPDITPGRLGIVGVRSEDELGDVIIAFVKHSGPNAKLAPLFTQMQQKLSTAMGLKLEAVIPLDRLPRTTSGKLKRFELADRYAGGEFLAQEKEIKSLAEKITCESDSKMDHVSTDSSKETTEILQKIVSDCADRTSIPIQANFFTLGLNSLVLTRIFGHLELRWPGLVTVKDLFERPTISQLGALIDNRTASAQTPQPTAEATQAEPIHIKSTPTEEVGADGGMEYRATAAQRRIWYLHHLYGAKTFAYHVCRAVRIKGPLDPARLGEALHKLFIRHESLRTAFRNRHGETLAYVNPPTGAHAALPLEFLRIGDANESVTEPGFRHPSTGQKKSAEQGGENAFLQMEQAARRLLRYFDLSQAPLLQCILVQGAKDEFLFVINAHHIICDGSSLRILLRDLRAFYRNEPLPPLGAQYSDYAHHQHSHSVRQQIDAQLRYWRKRFTSGIDPLELPTAVSRPAIKNLQGDTLRWRLDPEWTTVLQKCAKRNEATLFMTILTGYAVLLGRICGRTELTVGTVIEGRRLPRWTSVVGMFVNTLPVRFDLDPETDVSGLLATVKNAIAQTLAHRDTPFDILVDGLNLPRDPGRNPMFDVVISAQDPRPLNETSGPLRFSFHPFDLGVSQFDLTLEIEQISPTITLALHYDSNLFQRHTITALAEGLTTVLHQIATDSQKRFSTVDLLSRERYEQTYAKLDAEPTEAIASREGGFVKRPNDAQPALQATKTLVDLILAQAQNAPHRPAVLHANHQLTYGELIARATAVARHLRSFGVAPKDVVAVLVDRSEAMVIAVLGVLLARAAYLPLDLHWPRQRCRFMVRDANAGVLLTNQLDRVQSWNDLSIVDLNGALTDPGGTQRLQPTRGADPAYIIYTSGTTGKPKGVRVHHGNLIHLFDQDRMPFDFSARDVWTVFHSLGFDFSVWEIFGALTTGGRLVVVDDATRIDVAAFGALIEKHGITVLNQTPSAFVNLANHVLKKPAWTHRLRYVIFGGEPLHAALLADWHAHFPHVQLINMYGITETTIHVTHKTIGAADIAQSTRSVGTSLPAVRVWVSDRWGRPTLPGLVGEICVGGGGVAHGYLNQPQLTAHRFRFDPSTNSRYYKTGDRGRLNAENELEHLGRLDDQIQLFGYRIEPGEVQAALEKIPFVRAARVTLESKDGPDAHLAAWLVLEPQDPSEKEPRSAPFLRRHLAEWLPRHMIPSRYHTIPKLPVTATGKTDWKALKQNAVSLPSNTVPTPPNTTEEQIRQIWTAVLDNPSIALDDNFFDVGGNSMRLMRVHRQLETQLHTTLRPVDLLLYPTIRSLAAQLVESVSTKPSNTDVHKASLDGTGEPHTPDIASPSGAARFSARPAESHSLGRKIAIIGMSFRIGPHRSAETFWPELAAGKDLMAPPSKQRRADMETLADLYGFGPLGSPGQVGNQRPNAANRDLYNRNRAINTSPPDTAQSISEMAFLDRIDLFDPAFFQLSPRQASLIDPAHRLLLEVAYSALENAGYGGTALRSTSTGVYVGHSAPRLGYDRLALQAAGSLSTQAFVGTMSGALPGRIAHFFDFHGPTFCVDTACSSFMVALHLAVEGLRAGRCTTAVVGSAQVELLPLRFGVLSETRSPDGKTRTFDRDAAGFGSGEGVFAFVLKPLTTAIEAGDPILGVIRGTAINHDGRAAGLTAPNVEAQTQVLQAAWRDAAIDPTTLSYIEAHGTATPLGDPIEIEGLTRAFRAYTPRKQFCALGSIKANVGHLDAAAGGAGLLKCLLCLQQRKLVAQPHFDAPNPQIDFAASPVFVNEHTRPWTGQKPLRCGISAFGFSGTNSHIVLEAPPSQPPVTRETPILGSSIEGTQPSRFATEPTKATAHSARMSESVTRSAGSTPLLYLFVASAQSRHTLQKLASRCADFVAHQKPNMADLCFTAALGRGHHTHRLAVLAPDTTALAKRLAHFSSRRFAPAEESHVFYGRHEVIGASKPHADPGELYPHEKRMLDEKTAALSNTVRDTPTTHHLEQLAELYVQGGDPCWSVVFSRQRHRRLAFPGYPFAPQRCWPQLSTSSHETAPKKQAKAPQPGPAALQPSFLGFSVQKQVLRNAKLDLYSTHLDGSTDWPLSAHRIGGRAVLVGSAYLDIFAQLARHYYPAQPTVIEDIAFLKPVEVSAEGACELQILVEKHSNGLQVSIQTDPAAAFHSTVDGTRDRGLPILHTRGKIRAVSNANPPRRPEPPPSPPTTQTPPATERVSLTELKRRCPHHVEQPQIAAIQNAGPVETGPRWDNLAGAHFGSSAALAHLRLSDRYTDELTQFYWHPALLDVATSFAAAAQEPGRVPSTVQKIELFSTTPAEFYSFVEPSTAKAESAAGSGSGVYDITLCDPAGRNLARFVGFAFRRHPQASAPALEVFTRGWQPWHAAAGAFPDTTDASPKTAAPSSAALREKSVIVFGLDDARTHELCARLEKDVHRVIVVELGSRFQKTAFNRYTVSGAETDFAAVLGAVDPVDMIIVLWSGATAEDATAEPSPETDSSPQALQRDLKHGFWSAFHLLKALLAAKIPTVELRFVHLHAFSVNPDECPAHPAGGALAGLVRVIAQEHPGFSCRFLDVSPSLDPALLYTALWRFDLPPIVALRKSQIWTEQLEPVALPSPAPSLSLRNGGNYLVTGGLGGIGKILCTHLAKTTPVRLLVFGRTPLEHSKPKTAIAALEAHGAEVVYFAVDVSDRRAMRSALSTIHQRYGRIDGVIHCAGVVKTHFLETSTRRDFEQVLAPKIHATFLLDQLTRADRPDFFVLCSAATAWHGWRGQGDYTAANAFLNSYAAWRSAQGYRTVSINWPAWKNTGMTAGKPFDTDGLFYGLFPADGPLAFDKALAGGKTEVAVGRLNIPLLAGLRTELGLGLSSTLQDRFERMDERNRNVAAEGMAEPLADTPSVRLKGTRNGAYTALEQTVGDVWGAVLGLQEIDIHAELGSLGGDSISAVNIVNRLNRALKLEVTVQSIFTHRTVFEYARHLETHTAEKSPAPIADGAPAPPLPQAPQADDYPLSAAQRRLFVLHQIAPQSINYNLPEIRRIETPQGVSFFTARLGEALSKLVERHESLRTSFHLIEGRPRQRVHPPRPFTVKRRRIDEEMLSDAVFSFVRPFSLEKAPLMRVELLEISAGRAVLLFDVHHIVADAFSTEIMLDELIALAAGQRLPPVLRGYKDYAVWQQTLLQSKVSARDEAYWLAQFKDTVPVLELPLDHPRPPVQSFAGDMVSFKVDAPTTRRWSQFAEHNAVTLHAVLLAGLFELLHRYTRQTDIVVASISSGRNRAELERIVGPFINLLPIRAQPRNDVTSEKFITEVHQRVVSALDHQAYPFDALVDRLDLPKDLSRSPLADVNFSYMSFEGPQRAWQTAGLHDTEQLQITPYNGPIPRASKVDLMLFCRKLTHPPRLELDFEYCSTLFDRSTVKRFGRLFINLLSQMVAHPTALLSTLDLCDATARKNLWAALGDTFRSLPNDRTIIEAFDQHTDRHPQKTAVRCTTQVQSYRALQHASCALAQRLEQTLAGQRKPVAVLCERRVELLAALLAVGRAGCAFVPLDPQHPAQRLQTTLEHSQAAALLTSRQTETTLTFSGPRLCIDTIIDAPSGDAPSGEDSPVNASNSFLAFDRSRATDTAYIIYTSGTTGAPKGVAVSNRALSNFAYAMSEDIDLRNARSIGALTSISFDIFILEMLVPLTLGMQVELFDDTTVADVDQLTQSLRQTAVDTVQLTPSRLSVLLEVDPELDAFHAVERLLVGGEPFSDHLFHRVRETFTGRLFNLYGPTETTVWSSRAELTHAAKVTAGTPIANTRIHVVGENQLPLPLGVFGEIWIGGEGVAQGYHGGPTATAERFVQADFNDPGAAPHGREQCGAEKPRFYRTGDLGRWHEDGRLEVCGRIDRQLKVRGYRVEPAEVESVLMQSDAVESALVIGVPDRRKHLTLCAYLVPTARSGLETSDTVTIDFAALRDTLSMKLPAYMVPARYVTLAHIPLTPNGKVDVSRLPSPDARSVVQRRPFVAPRDDLESRIGTVWKEVLELERVPVSENFFDLGGNSIKLVSAAAALSRRLKRPVEIVDLFMHPTIEALAAYLRRCSENRSDHSSLAASADHSPRRRSNRLSQRRKRLEKAPPNIDGPHHTED